MATLTVNPQAGSGGGNVSVDGYVLNSIAQNAWATVHDAASGTTADGTSINVLGPRIRAGSTSNLWNLITRMYFTIDTSALTAAASISAATFSVFNETGGVQNQFAGGSSVSLVGCTPASNNALVAGDYSQTQTTKYATDIALGSFVDGGFNDFALNATGIAAISKTGITKFALCLAEDVANTPPTWGNGLESYFQCDFADNLLNIPKLAITYTLPDTRGNFFLLFQ